MTRAATAIAIVIAAAIPVSLRHDAAACLVVPRTEAPRLPSLAAEQVLIVYDKATEQEHFVREVTFKNGGGAFGFVVPTPTRPDVGAVPNAPFAALRKAFPFQGRELGSAGYGAGDTSRSIRGDGVRVLEQKKVGSFTTFVLAADDAGALGTWLTDNRLSRTPDAEPWLAHYVAMKFFYVAMRYDPPKERAIVPAGEVASETVRISFSTPLPYYPYFEPTSKELRSERLLDLWVISSSAVVPVALALEGDKRSWVRPMKEGASVDLRAFPETLLDPALRSLVPVGRVTVQTFEDQKLSREGYGDVLFVPATKELADEGRRAKLRVLAPILDPSRVPR